MLNQVIVMGRLTRDPELRRTQSGTAVASFSVACERDFKDADGEKATDFFDVIAWRNTAEFVSKYFAKGRMAVVSGRLQARTYKTKDGDNRHVVEVVAENVYFGDSKNERGERTIPQSASPAAPFTQGSLNGGFGVPAAPVFSTIDEDEDFPF